MNKNLAPAIRFLAYIHSINGDPIPSGAALIASEPLVFSVSMNARGKAHLRRPHAPQRPRPGSHLSKGLLTGGGGSCAGAGDHSYSRRRLRCRARSLITRQFTETIPHLLRILRPPTCSMGLAKSGDPAQAREI
jgi:hypothetical protein